MSYMPDLSITITPLIVFGLLLIVGPVGGYISHRLKWLPSITGFMAVGFLVGPSGLGILDKESLHEARILVDISLGLILYRLGLSIDFKYLARAKWLFVASVAESAATFLVVLYVLSYLGVVWPLSALIAAIFISSSPAVLLHVANEIGAEGEVTRSSESLVALNNVFSFVLFSATLPFMHYTTGAEWSTVMIQPLYRFGGSLFVGIAMGFALHIFVKKTLHVAQYRLAFVIGAIMLAVGLAHELKLSILMAPLVMGIVVKNVERYSVISGISFGESFELFFIILFVYAGSQLHLAELAEYYPIIFALVMARVVAKVAGVTFSSLIAKRPFRSGLSGALLLVPMAGMAIGLVQTSDYLFPEHADRISALVLGAVAVFETIGPPIAAFAIRLCGEVNNEVA